MREATDDGKGNITFTDDNADGTVEVPKDIYVQKYEGGQYTLNGVSSANPLIQGYLMVKPDMEQFLMDVTIMAPDASGVPQDLIVRDIPVNAPAPAVDSGKVTICSMPAITTTYVSASTPPNKSTLPPL